MYQVTLANIRKSTFVYEDLEDKVEGLLWAARGGRPLPGTTVKDIPVLSSLLGLFEALSVYDGDGMDAHFMALVTEYCKTHKNLAPRMKSIIRSLLWS